MGVINHHSRSFIYKNKLVIILILNFFRIFIRDEATTTTNKTFNFVSKNKDGHQFKYQYN